MHEASKEMEVTEGFGSALYQNLQEVQRITPMKNHCTNLTKLMSFWFLSIRSHCQNSTYQSRIVTIYLQSLTCSTSCLFSKQYPFNYQVLPVCCCFNLSIVRQWGGEQRATRFSSLSFAPGRLNEIIKKDWIKKIGLNKKDWIE